MNFYNLQSAHFTNFSAPICNDARRAHNCKMRCPCVFQRYHRGDCLYGFTKSHFISEKNALLVQCIFNAPFLVTTQLAQQTDGMPVTELHAILTILREILQMLTGGSPRDEKLAAMLADAISRMQMQVNAVFDPREAGRALAPEVDKRQGGTAVLRERGVI